MLQLEWKLYNIRLSISVDFFKLSEDYTIGVVAQNATLDEEGKVAYKLIEMQRAILRNS